MRTLDESKLHLVYDCIRTYQAQEGRSPTLREIAKACGIGSLEWVSNLVSILAERGKIEMEIKGNRRSIAIPDKLVATECVTVPIVGSCPCGEPVQAIENILSTVSLPVSIFGHGPHFILTANGRSMIKRGIHDGDLMVVRTTKDASVGQVVIARVNNEEATAKILAQKDGRYYLKPANDELDEDGKPLYKDIHPKGQWEILGVVDHVIHATAKEV